ncbi:uncharacterized protein LOC143877793 [Tasmannia lanceolata]|uniref:uncharacterized protein LOC143877793 n=1 Tax=Tasmannia lanceolata TaxID=3420 RepID=UPI0040644F78
MPIYCYQRSHLTNAHMNMDMEAYPESEDDAMFTDIKRQILLLMMEEEDVLDSKSLITVNKNPPLIPLQLGSFDPWTLNSDHHGLFWPENENWTPGPTRKEPNNVGSWGLLRKDRDSKGTGVFIPCSHYQRKKSKTERKTRTKQPVMGVSASK